MKIRDITPKPHLYLDMDGVQADFFTAWAQWHNRKFAQSHVERYKDIGSREQREQSISDLNTEGPEFIEQFFRTLPTLPGGQKLIGWLRNNKIPFTVLSAPLRGNEEASIMGKRRWLDLHNIGASDNAIFTSNKAQLATRGGHSNVLVDDFKKYINAWNEAGGTAILYRDDKVDDVIRQLSAIYDVPVNEDLLSPTVRLKTYQVRIKLQQPGYKQQIDTTVTARNPEQARRIIRQQYNDHNIMVGQPREIKENFADGRRPQDRGDSRRHGIPQKATLKTLDAIVASDTASPRKKQLAHWQANMRRGRARKDR